MIKCAFACSHKSEQVAREFFPEMQLEVVKGANHWGKPLLFCANTALPQHFITVHAEKPHEFTDLVVKFCQ